MSRASSDGYDVGTVTCTQETSKALLVEGECLPKGKMWLPKSVVHDDSEVYEIGHEGKLVVKEWFAEKEGL